jgi:hypothetical protein
VLADLTESRAAAVYAALTELERLAALIPAAPGLADRMAVADVISARHARYRELLDTFGDVHDLRPEMAEAAPALDEARRRVATEEWWEGLAAAALCAPLTDELFSALLDHDDEPVEVVPWASHRLRAALGGDPTLTARIALWGRRLIGEAIVLCREFGGERYTELADRLAASHARRLTELGLVD